MSEIKNTNQEGFNQAEEAKVEATPDTALAIVNQSKVVTVADRKKALEALKKITSYTGKPPKKLDEFIGKVMKVKGVIVHPASIGKDNINTVTGEIIREYEEMDRVVFKLENDDVVGACSIAVNNFVGTWLIPIFGQGDWLDEEGKEVIVPISIAQVTTPKGRSYNLQIVD